MITHVLKEKLYQFLKWRKYIKAELENQFRNRELIGVDRDGSYDDVGNEYYQYYSYWGLPTRREVHFRIKGDYNLRDLVYFNWLYKRDLHPPTQAEKQLFYQQEKLRLEKARQWDEREQLLLEEMNRRRQELRLRDMALKQLEDQYNKKNELELRSLRVEDNMVDMKAISSQRVSQEEIRKKQHNDTQQELRKQAAKNQEPFFKE